MGERKEILLENYKEYFDLALRAYDEGKFNSATTLFFKSICAAADLFILSKENRVPSSHTDRFRVARNYPVCMIC